METTPTRATTPATTPAAPPCWRRKVRYHHGDLLQSALARGREIVGLYGPSALTLRGLARDLGVTATALVHLFGSVAGMREAVAGSVLEQLEGACALRAARPRRDVLADWVAFAAANANLYRLACGEGWVVQRARPTGANGRLATPSPRRFLETALGGGRRRGKAPDARVEAARLVAFTVHGLALARVDGVPEDVVARELGDLLVRSERPPRRGAEGGGRYLA